ncbi:MAG: hypothetical protein ACHQJ6_09285 [Candidatus Berkiellales bacterium]
MKLVEKLLDKTQPIIFYELLPPTDHAKPTSLEAYIECAMDLLIDSPVVIDAVNIPDVREEEINGDLDKDKFVPKIPSGYFAKMLEQGSYQHLEVILNHCTVYEPWPEQKKWLKSIHDLAIGSLILVGGSSSKIHYPGPSVIEMADYIQENYHDILLGGITIQSRRKSDPMQDEPFRIYTKSLHGLEYFTSQIVYDAVSVKLLLRDYANLCREKGVAPKRIILSFAPISTKKDLEFMRWLGVVVPPSVEEYLFKADMGIGWRSAKVATNLFQDILQFMRDSNIAIPIGLNIEHITRHNFEISIQFLERLGGLYYRYSGR